MKIIASIASCANNTERQLMRDFHDSILNFYLKKENVKDQRELEKKRGTSIYLNYDSDLEPCDIAIQFGVAKDRANDHHVARNKIKQNAQNIIYLETPLLGRTISGKNIYPSYRVGVNGFLNSEGVFYVDGQLDKTRLEKLREVSFFPKFTGWKEHKKGNILILLQLPGDASLRGQRISEWLADTIDEIRSFTLRNITIRLHPAMSGKGKNEFFSELGDLICKNYPNLFWSDNSRTLDQDLSQAGVCISYTSGASIDAILQGVPVITVDEGNLAYEISSRKIRDLSSPRLASNIEVEEWLHKIANSQWTTTEIENGTVWNHLRFVLSSIGVSGV
jgi:hypothetical protein